MEIIIVVQLAISIKQLVSFLFHFEQVWGGIDRLIVWIILYFDRWEVLIGPWATVRVSVLVVFTLKELLSLIFIHCNLFKKRKRSIKHTFDFTYKVADQT